MLALSKDVECCPRAGPPQYGVICPHHGPVPLREAEYLKQLDRPDELWQCPVCKRIAQWDNNSLETCSV